MQVQVTIDVGPCDPAIPKTAKAIVTYGGQARFITWTYTGRSHPESGRSLDDYIRTTVNPGGNGQEWTQTEHLVQLHRNHSLDPMKVADAGPLQRQVAQYVGSILPTILAAAS